MPHWRISPILGKSVHAMTVPLASTMPIVRSTISLICRIIDWNNLEAICNHLSERCYCESVSKVDSYVPFLSVIIVHKFPLLRMFILSHYTTYDKIFVQIIKKYFVIFIKNDLKHSINSIS